MAVVDVGVRLDTRDLERRLKGVSGITDKEARAIAAAMAKAGRAIEGTAGSSDLAARALARVGDAGGAAGGAAAKLGGILDTIAPGLGDVARLGNDIGDALEVAGQAAGSLGPATVALGAGLAVAAAGFAALERDIQREAEAAAWAREQHALLVPTLRATEDATIRLQVATGQLTEAQARQAEAALGAQRAVLDLGARQAEAAAALRGEQETAQRWLDLTTSILPMAVNPAAQAADALFGWSETIATSEARLQALGDTVEQEAQAQAYLAEVVVGTGDALDEQARASARSTSASQAAAEAVAQEAAARDALLRVLSAGSAAVADLRDLQAEMEGQGSRLAAVEAQRAERLDSIARSYEAIALAQGEEVAAAEAVAAMAAVEADAQRQREELRLQAVAQLSAAQETAHREQLQRLERERAAVVGGVSQALGAISSLAGTAAQAQGEAQAEAAARLFRLQKGAAIAQIGVDSATAIVKALATLGPIGGAFAVAGITAAAAAQTAAVAAQELPAYHRGGLVQARQPGEVLARLEPGESVLTRRGTAAAGGETGVSSLNRGEGPSTGAGQPSELSAMLRGRYDDALRYTVWRTGPRPGGRPGRR